VSREVSPPTISNLTFVRKLGSGGYADVYLYEQAMPARRVAVKVLREAGLSVNVRQRFEGEANAMARLEHPHIVPVYAAGTTTDGHPYLVMMYYPLASLAERVRRERFAVADVLRVGIQLASAVETAHRAGLLHRDIKPGNVLMSQYNSPGLTDFGIAAQIADEDDDAPGVSVPWSPPESLYLTHPAGPRSDVYSLAATLWTLLVGRSPFEIAGGDNSQFGLMKRIRDIPAPSTGRPDVPASLDRLLRTSMAKEPGVRPASALELARSLQAVEMELRLQRTEIVLAGEGAEVGGPPDTGERTQVRAVTRVSPDVRGDDRPTVASGISPSNNAAAGRVAPPEAADTSPPRRAASLFSRRGVAVVVVGLLLTAVVVIGVVLIRPGMPRVVSPTTSVSVPPPDVGTGALPPGTVTLTWQRSGTELLVGWTYGNRMEGDALAWRFKGDYSFHLTTNQPFAITAPAVGQVCIEVQVRRVGGGSSTGTWSEGCS
jgi:eukaryotic-like serine/threonine-protein kinase